MIDYQTAQQGERLKEIRRSLEKTQIRWARELGLTQAYISALESGDRVISSGVYSTIKKLYPAINLEWIFSGDGDMFLSENRLASTVHCTPNPVHLMAELVHLTAPNEVQEPPGSYIAKEEELSALRLRIKRLELFISQKFPDFPLDQL